MILFLNLFTYFIYVLCMYRNFPIKKNINIIYILKQTKYKYAYNDMIHKLKI
jgi:hypothetical protein